jgi:prepilin-type N-terminal cleavage/methylation domain-containing protein
MPLRKSAGGFTVTELLAVLAILALLLAMVLPVIGPMRRHGRLQQGAAGVSAALTAARALAIARVRDCLVYTIDHAAGDEIAVYLADDTDAARTERMPAGVDFCGTLPSPGSIRFRPDGSCSPGVEILIRGEDGSRRRISVSPASGRTKVETVK